MNLNHEGQLERKTFTSNAEGLSLDLVVLVHQQVHPIDYFVTVPKGYKYKILNHK